jgi:hypothetical protein
MDQNKLPVEPCQQGVTSGSFKMVSEPMVRFAQTVPLSYIQMDRNEFPHDPRHVGVPFDASKMIPSLWYVWCIPCTYLALRLALSPKTDLNELPVEPRNLGVPSGVSKMIYEPMVCFVRTVTLSSPTLTPSPNRSKQDSTGPTSPRSSIGCIQSNF